MSRYTTIADAIERAILPALGEFGDGYDVAAIAREAFVYRVDHNDASNDGFEQVCDNAGFWEIVERHTLVLVPPADELAANDANEALTFQPLPISEESALSLGDGPTGIDLIEMRRGIRESNATPATDAGYLAAARRFALGEGPRPPAIRINVERAEFSDPPLSRFPAADAMATGPAAARNGWWIDLEEAQQHFRLRASDQGLKLVCMRCPGTTPETWVSFDTSMVALSTLLRAVHMHRADAHE